MNKKLDHSLDTVEIKQTRSNRSTINFKDSAIDKITKLNTDFENRKFKTYKFNIPKGSSLKGLQLRFYKNTEIKNFVLSIWFNSRNSYYIIGKYPNISSIMSKLTNIINYLPGVWIF